MIRDWAAIEQSAGDPNASGDRTELLALADRETAMADRLHTATMQAGSQPVKDALSTWTQGVRMSANIEGEIATAATDQPPPAREPAARAADMHRAAQLIGTASADLRTSCPTMPPR